MFGEQPLALPGRLNIYIKLQPFSQLKMRIILVDREVSGLFWDLFGLNFGQTLAEKPRQAGASSESTHVGQGSGKLQSIKSPI